MKKSKAEHNEYQKQWRLKNPEKYRERVKRYKGRHKERQKIRAREYYYGITNDQYQALWSSQEGRCAICGGCFESLAIDHDHASGFVRGLLCGNCNLGLGNFKDSVVRLQDAIDYLKWSRAEEDK